MIKIFYLVFILNTPTGVEVQRLEQPSLTVCQNKLYIYTPLLGEEASMECAAIDENLVI